MREKMDEFGVNNISIVQMRWEDVDVEKNLQPPYDVVIASFSLGMQDIRAALQAENGALVLPDSSIRVKMWWEK